MQASSILFLAMAASSLASMSSNLQADMSLVQNIDPASLAAEVPSIVNSFMDQERTALQSSSSATSTEIITVVEAYPSEYTLSHPGPGPGVVVATTTVTPLGGKAGSIPSLSASGSGIASPVVPWAPHPHLEVVTRTGFNGSVYTITRVDEGSKTVTVSEVTRNGTRFMVSEDPTTSSLAPPPTATDTVTSISTVTPSPGLSAPTVAPTAITETVTVTQPAPPAITADPFQGHALYQCKNDEVVPYKAQPSDFRAALEALGAPMGMDLGYLDNSSYHNTFDAYPHDPSHFVPDRTEVEELKARCAKENLPVRERYEVLWEAPMPGGYDDYDRARTVTASAEPSATVLMRGAMQKIGGRMYAVPETQDWKTTKTATLVADHSTLYTISFSKGTYGTEHYELSSSRIPITQTVSVIQLPSTTLTKSGYRSEGGFLRKHKHHHSVDAYVNQPTCERVVQVVDIGMCGGKRHLVQLNAITHAPAAQAPLCHNHRVPFNKAQKSCKSEWCMYQHQKPMIITTVQSAYVQKGDGPESHWANITQHYWETLPHWGRTKDKLIYWPFSLTSTTQKKKGGYGKPFAALDSDYSSRTRNSLVAEAPRCWDRETCADVCHKEAFHRFGMFSGYNLFWLLALLAGIFILPCCCCCCCLPWIRRRRQAREKQQGGAAGAAESGHGQGGEAVVVTTTGGGGQGGQGGETVVTTTSGDGGKVVEKVSGPTEVVTTTGGGGGQTVVTGGGGGGGGGGPQGGGSQTVVTTTEEEKKPGLLGALKRRKSEKV